MDISLGHTVVAGIVLTVAISLVARWMTLRANPRGLPFPPGPAGKLFVGNLGHVPEATNPDSWREFRKLAKSYGDLVYFRGLGNSILNVNSYQIANDLLNKKGAIYSDRPSFAFLKEVYGWKWHLIIMSYRDGFLEHRKLIQQSFQQQSIVLFRPIIARGMRVFVNRLQTEPEGLHRHLKHLAASTIMMITYGHQVAIKNDPWVKLAEDVQATAAYFPGSQIVDLIPILRHLPSWFPGWRKMSKHAAYVRSLSEAMRNKPFEQAKERIANGTAVPSLVTQLLESDITASQLWSEDDLVRNVTGVMYSAGADTTVTAITNFFLAMMQYPEAQERARQELNTVVGYDRLPNFNDRADLPYVSAMIKEVLRWKPVAPLAIVHLSTQADEYDGKFIPAKTMVIPNVAAMLQDETVYPEPENFKPDRFLGENPNPDPARVCWGFGRRICPGRFFAEEVVFLTIASVLQNFRISHPPDSNGQPVDLNVKWSAGLVAVPSQFPCAIQPQLEAKQFLANMIVD